MKLDEKEIVTLQDGPLDGLEIEARPSHTELWPGPHHRREHGISCRLRYQRCADDLFWWDGVTYD